MNHRLLMGMFQLMKWITCNLTHVRNMNHCNTLVLDSSWKSSGARHHCNTNSSDNLLSHRKQHVKSLASSAKPAAGPQKAPGSTWMLTGMQHWRHTEIQRGIPGAGVCYWCSWSNIQLAWKLMTMITQRGSFIMSYNSWLMWQLYNIKQHMLHA